MDRGTTNTLRRMLHSLRSTVETSRQGGRAQESIVRHVREFGAYENTLGSVFICEYIRKYLLPRASSVEQVECVSVW